MISCNPTKQLSLPQKNSVVQRVESLIKNLNDRNLDQLDDFYSEDFKSLSPLLSHSKKEIVSSLKKNLTENQNLFKGDILEVKSGNEQAFVLLRWRIFSPTEGEEWEITFDKHVLQIWDLHATHNWTLSRTLYYQPLPN